MDERGKNCGIPRFYKNKRLLGSVNLPPVDPTGNKSLMQNGQKQAVGALGKEMKE